MNLRRYRVMLHDDQSGGRDTSLALVDARIPLLGEREFPRAAGASAEYIQKTYKKRSALLHKPR